CSRTVQKDAKHWLGRRGICRTCYQRQYKRRAPPGVISPATKKWQKENPARARMLRKKSLAAWIKRNPERARLAAIKRVLAYQARKRATDPAWVKARIAYGAAYRAKMKADPVKYARYREQIKRATERRR